MWLERNYMLPSHQNATLVRSTLCFFAKNPAHITSLYTLLRRLFTLHCVMYTSKSTHSINTKQNYARVKCLNFNLLRRAQRIKKQDMTASESSNELKLSRWEVPQETCDFVHQNAPRENEGHRTETGKPKPAAKMSDGSIYNIEYISKWCGKVWFNSSSCQEEALKSLYLN